MCRIGDQQILTTIYCRQVDFFQGFKTLADASAKLQESLGNKLEGSLVAEISSSGRILVPRLHWYWRCRNHRRGS